MIPAKVRALAMDRRPCAVYLLTSRDGLHERWGYWRYEQNLRRAKPTPEHIRATVELNGVTATEITFFE